MTKAHRLKERKSLAKKAGVPINFLLGCSDSSLVNYELARLSELADERKRLFSSIDQMVENLAQTRIAKWFRTMDRNALKHAIENEETPAEWARRVIRDGQRGEEELSASVPSAPGVAHLAAALRYQERNIADGLCAVCPRSLDRNSVRFCTKHLIAARERGRKGKAVRADPGSREYLYAGELADLGPGRQLLGAASRAMMHEQHTRAHLAKLGVSPDSAAVSLNAAVVALVKFIPIRKADAIAEVDLFRKAMVHRTTGRRALKQLHSAGQVQRIGTGVARDCYRYFRGHEWRRDVPETYVG